MSHSKFTYVLLFLIVTNCNSEKKEVSESDYVKLDEYETIVSYEDMQVFTPTVLTIADGILYVYDYSVGHVITFDSEGNFIGEIGRSGQGPGEFYLLNKIHVHDDTLHFVDFGQFLIHSYKKNGEHISSADYGELGYFTSPSPPMSTGAVMARDLTHQPHVTLQGNFLLSPFLAGELPEKMFDLVNRDGEIISRMGDVPEGSTTLIEPNEHREAISNNEVPPRDFANAFPVNDRANPDEYFLIYTAFPKIEKYNNAGEKLWETDNISAPELDEVTERYYHVMEGLTRSSWIPLNKYMAGVSSWEGELFLATNTNPEIPGTLWIHRFNTEGELIRRYKIISDVNIPPVFDIDFSMEKLFLLTNEGEIRAYDFNLN